MNLFFWRKKKEEPRAEVPKPETAPEVDDWVKKTGDWSKRELCHCGQKRKWYSHNPYGSQDSGSHDICPKCGHEDKWETFVARDIWEESPAREMFYERQFLRTYQWEKWHRNQSIERWTPDHCPIKE